MKRFSGVVLALGLVGLPMAGHAAAIDFTDNFDSGASSHWQNQLGTWSASGGSYNAAAPSNSPITYSTLDFNFLNSALTTINVDFLSEGDGGIYISDSGTPNSGILLVVGGNGYGPSNGAFGGTGLYWHVVTNGVAGGVQNPAGVSGLSPGGDYHITLTALNGDYSAYVNGVLRTTLHDVSFAGGQVGLYDTYGPTRFDNFHVTGTVADATVAGVPEPASWALMIGGFGLAGATLRRRRTASALA